MANPFVHIELNTGDLQRAKQFYRNIFGWKMEDTPMGPGMTYTILDVGKGTGGGMQQKPMPEAPTMWLPYVEVASVEETIAKAREGGAQVFVDYMEIPDGMGAIGIFGDPTGAALGVWEMAKTAAKKTVKKAPKRAATKAQKKAPKKAAKKVASKASKKKAGGKKR